MTVESVTGEANLMRVKQPKFLSLVNKPANMTAFRVVRSDTEGEPKMKSPVVRRQRRSETGPIMQLAFPKDYTDEEVTQQMDAFGLAGYNVAKREDGIIVALRGDLKSISPDSVTDIKLTEDGIVASVARLDAPSVNPKSNLTVVSLAFRGDKFNPLAVEVWAKTNGIELPAAAIAEAQGEGDIVVTRHEVAEGEETRVVEIEEGVKATIVRSDAMDIPEGFVAVVNESAYGNWGWGQLDFAAGMADEAFTEAMDNAVYRLRDVLKNILLYSALPLAERKVLMARALEQFNVFATGVLDSLPRTVLVAVVRSASTPLKETEMSKKEESGAPSQSAPAADDDSKPVTRGEMKTMLAEAVTAALASKAPATETAARSEGGEVKKEGGTEAPAASPAAPEEKPVTRADLATAFSEAVAPLVERLAKVEGTTVVRSDVGDSKVDVTKTEEGKGKDADVFRGAPVFGGLGLSRARN